MPDQLVVLAALLPALVDQGSVDADSAVVALAEEASWSGRRLRNAAVDAQQDPDATSRSVSLLHQAADWADARAASIPAGATDRGAGEIQRPGVARTRR